MEELFLKLIDVNDKVIVLDFIRELVAFGSNRDGIWFEDSKNFEEMLTKLRELEKVKFECYEQTKPANFQYLLLRKLDNKLVGMFSIRPFLTIKLDLDFGGNIGYSIRPSERNKGYASEGLRLALLVCKEKHMSEAILCCYKDNFGSKKAILKNGGKLIEEKDAIIVEQKYIIKI